MTAAILDPGPLCKSVPHNPRTQRNDSLKASHGHTNNTTAATGTPVLQEKLHTSGGKQLKVSKEVINLKEKQTLLQH